MEINGPRDGKKCCKNGRITILALLSEFGLALRRGWKNMFEKYMKHLPLIISLTGFLLVVVPLSQVHVAIDFTDLPLGEFFLEQITPISFWVGIAIIVSSAFLSLKSDRTSRTYFIFSSIALVIAIRAVLPLVMSKPYSIDVFDYIYWMKAWLTKGFQFTPGPSITTSLLAYYPHTHPISFLIAYAFVKGGVPINTFFTWAPSIVYAVDAILMFLLSRAIGFKPIEATVSTFLMPAATSFGEVITQWYCPQLVGSAAFLLSIYMVIKVSKSEYAPVKPASLEHRNGALETSITKGRNHHVRLQMLTMLSILILIFTHHLSTLYFIIVLLGFFLTQRLLKWLRFSGPKLHVSPFWMIYTSATWGLVAYFIYPERLFYWIDTARTYLSQFMSGTARGVGDIHGVSLSYWLKLPVVDKISSTSYAISVLVLCAIQVAVLSKVDAKGGGFRMALKRLGRSLFNDELNSTILGFVSGLFVFFVVGLLLGGFAYPLRMISFIMFFLIMIAAQPLARTFEGRASKRLKIMIVVVMILLVFISAHWIFRTFQRNVPAWEKAIPTTPYP